MQTDKLIKDIWKLEERNNSFLHLTANENQMSRTAASFLPLKLSERYYFGGGEDGVVDFNPLTFVGMRPLEELVMAAEEAVKKMLGGEGVNLRCLSGIHAMMCTILSVTEPGDCVMTVRHEDGGHFATKGILARVGRKHVFASYDYLRGGFNIEQIASDCKENNVKAIYFDLSYYIDKTDLKDIRAAVGEKVIIIFDASHTMGLLMGGQLQNPFLEGVDIVCANTHKTLPGPQKGMIVFRDKDLADRANGIIGASLISSSHTHHLASLAVTILEMERYGHAYAKKIVENANAIGAAFERLGYEVRKTRDGNYSHTHQAHVFIDKKEERGVLYRRLVQNNISTNFDNPLGGRLFIRIGTQELTRRGMDFVEMTEIANLMHRAMQGEDVMGEVRKLNSDFTKIKFSFDDESDGKS
jgi:glycine hydroxymethyltransferase